MSPHFQKQNLKGKESIPLDEGDMFLSVAFPDKMLFMKELSPKTLTQRRVKFGNENFINNHNFNFIVILQGLLNIYQNHNIKSCIKQCLKKVEK